MADEAGVRAEQDAIHAVASAILGKHEHALRGGMLTGWVLITEWLGSDGERWIHTVISENTAPWQVSGYLRSATLDVDDTLRGSDRDEDE